MFEVEVYDKIKQRNVDIYDDYSVTEGNFELFMSTVLFQPPKSHIVSKARKETLDKQSKYRIRLKSKDYIYIDNFNSLKMISNLEIKNVALDNRNILLTKDNNHVKWLNLDNSKINVAITCNVYKDSQEYVLRKENKLFNENLSKIKDLALPFKISIELHTISGDDEYIDVLDDDGNPTGFIINTNNQVRYRFYFTMIGNY